MRLGPVSVELKSYSSTTYKALRFSKQIQVHIEIKIYKEEKKKKENEKKKNNFRYRYPSKFIGQVNSISIKLMKFVLLRLIHPTIRLSKQDNSRCWK